MNKRSLIACCRVLFGLLVLAAVITQFIDSAGKGRSIANFFSYFTIQSNLLAAAAVLALGFTGLGGNRKKDLSRLTLIRGGVTLYMSMTGIIFALLLSGLAKELQTTIPWVNLVLHYIMPAFMIADWLIFPPAAGIPFKKALRWLIYPLVYLVYSWIRGEFVHWYPYPFIDPVAGGWPKVLLTCLLITACILLIVKLMTLYVRGSHAGSNDYTL